MKRLTILFSLITCLLISNNGYSQLGYYKMRDSKTQKYALFSPSYKNITGYIYDNICCINEGLAGAVVEGKWGLINMKGGMVIPFQFEEINDFYDGIANVKVNGKWGCINPKGEFIVAPKFDKIGGFYDNFATIVNDGKWGFVDENGRIIVKPQYSDASIFSEKKAAVKVGHKWGYINKYGKIIIAPTYESAGAFSEDLAPVQKNGKWGFIGKEGEIIIPFIYSDAYGFDEGEAEVEFDNGNNIQTFYIDKKGNKREWVNTSFFYLDENLKKSVETQCAEYLNPFSGYDYIKPVGGMKDDCYHATMLYGKGYIDYIDRKNKESFVLGSIINSDGVFTKATIYTFDSDDSLIKSYNTRIVNGLIVEIIPINDQKNKFREKFITSLIIASAGTTLNKDLTLTEAFGCALIYNINDIVEDKIVAKILSETVNNYTHNKNFESKEIIKDLLESELKSNLLNKANLNNTQIQNMLSFIECILQ